MNFISLFLTSFLFSMILTPLTIRFAAKKNLFDSLSERKVHRKEVPRIGGFSLYISFLIANIIFNKQIFTQWYILCCATIIFFLGLLDDIKNLSSKTKFIWQIIVATIFVILSNYSIQSINSFLPGVDIPLGFLAIPFSIFFLIFIMNAINLADGLDGLASGISLIATIFLLYFSIRFNDMTSSLLLITVLGSILGFLKYNSYPAKVFMGDSGSIFLGFILGSISLKYLSEIKHIPFYTIAMIIGIPCLDMLNVVYQRKKNKKAIFSADQSHFHHRLMNIGLTHAESVKLILFLTMISCIIGSMPFVFPKRYAWSLWPTGIIFLFSIIFLCYKMPKGFLLNLKGKYNTRYLRGYLKKRKSFRLPILITKILKYTIIISFLLPAAFTSSIPSFLGIISFAMAGILLTSLLVNNIKINDYIIFIFYMSVLVLLAANNYNPIIFSISSLHYNITWIYNSLFIIIILFSFLKAIFDVQSRYFKISNLDFLILLLPLFLTIVQRSTVTEYHLHSISLKFLIIFFATKILFLRKVKHNRRVLISVVIGLTIVGIVGGLKIKLGI
ncbi:MAG: undecaprenyl/decaprenyl-phosphate alpha-N-acetylglucosaminyl 1-phosphate transferase [Candidatus Aureabacteria bacterium]|nr:undecaprenyl/decaprenyl-phosphate alpha-N-acetylglucosaminyl 1-phosphate transferase [Candidatus Auribacterota bacterium]